MGHVHTTSPVRRGSYGKAMDAFTRITPESRASNSVGYLCLMDGKYQQAEEYFVEAIKQSPAYYAETHDNLQKAKALAYQSAGPRARARLGVSMTGGLAPMRRTVRLIVWSAAWTRGSVSIRRLPPPCDAVQIIDAHIPSTGGWG